MARTPSLHASYSAAFTFSAGFSSLGGARLLRICLLVFVSTLHPIASAQINVTTTTIQGVSDISNCTLQEAMYATMFGGPYALNQTDPDVSYKTGCTDPSGFWYQIVLPGGTMQFNQLWDGDGHNPFGPTATPIVCNFIDIKGNGTTLQWTGSGNSRMFAVGYATFSPTSGPMTGTFCGVVTPSLTLENVYIKGFQTKGGDGMGGGGGGLGAGGAIYIGRLPGKDQPSLTIQNSTFDGNTATGGQGGGCGFPAHTTDCTGGGGGLAGKGGTGSVGDGGGGGGGARGDGGAALGHAGGGGGGTVYGNGDAHDNIGGAAGVYCGGNGGDDGNDGHNGGPCAGGGGGGGGDASLLCGVGLGPCGNGGAGSYGGGGGGGGAGGHGNGGNGGFGGGGGAASDCCSGDGHSPDTGGNGGFGGGAGLGNNGITSGAAGRFGGDAFPGLDGGFGGLGAGLGGAIFSDGGSVTIQNSTFVNNKVADGRTSQSCCAENSGAAIFLRNGSLTVESSTIARNFGDLGYGITVFNDNKDTPTSFTLHNTIIDVKDGFGNFPCFYFATTADAVAFTAAGNLITGTGAPSFSASAYPQLSDCTVGTVSTADPKLGTLQTNSPGNTPTMAIPYGTSPAIDAGDDSVALIDGITTDQRGVTRPQGSHVDIGAYEATVKYPLTLQVSPLGGGFTTPYGTVWEDPNAVVDVSATAAPGYYFLNWTGNVASANSASTTVTMPSQAETATANFQLHDFSITSSVNPLNLKLGGSASTTLTVSSLGNFADKVTLTAVGTGIPAGVTVSLSPTSLTPAVGGSLTATLGFTAGASVTPANFSEAVTGSSTGLSGPLSHGVPESVNMTVTAADIINVVNQNQTLGCIDNSGIAQSLNAKLNAFQNLTAGGHMGAAVNTIASFQYEAQAQAGRHIASNCKDGSGTSFSPAQTLITDTTYLLTSAGAAKVQANPITGSVVNSANSGISGATVNLLSSSKTVIATSTTDAVGFYYFSGTSGLAPGASYTVAVTAPKGYKSSMPASQIFTWHSTSVALNKFALN